MPCIGNVGARLVRNSGPIRGEGHEHCAVVYLCAGADHPGKALDRHFYCRPLVPCKRMMMCWFSLPSVFLLRSYLLSVCSVAGYAVLGPHHTTPHHTTPHHTIPYHTTPPQVSCPEYTGPTLGPRMAHENKRSFTAGQLTQARRQSGMTKMSAGSSGTMERTQVSTSGSGNVTFGANVSSQK